MGYQAIGTLGRSIVDGKKEVKLFGEPIEIRASIKKLEGLSGHADKNGLIGWLQKFEKSRTECLSYMVKMQSVLHLPSA